eukprot:21004-Heterococcus_DN1.PRE.1
MTSTANSISAGTDTQSSECVSYLMPLTQSSVGSMLVGTTCPPGHMQKLLHNGVMFGAAHACFVSWQEALLAGETQYWLDRRTCYCR